jgi:GntR family transcriptional regulator
LEVGMQIDPAPPVGARVLAYLSQSALAPGDQLPSEAELSRQLGISRGTLREEYAKLAIEGVIERRHGVGTFLKRQLMDINPSTQQGFWNTIAAAGYEPAIQVVEIATIPAAADIAEELAIAPGAAVTRLVWVFRADGRPVVYAEHMLSPRLDLSGVDLTPTTNLMDILNRLRPLSGGRLVTWKTAVTATEAVAARLELQTGDALLYGRALVVTADEEPIATSRLWMEPRLMGEKLVTPILLRDAR